MQDDTRIPVLTDLIEKDVGAELTKLRMEQEIHRILDRHMEAAWQEIRIAIRQHLGEPASAKKPPESL